MKRICFSAFFAGALLVACSGTTEPEDKIIVDENGNEFPESALEEILVTDWEAEGLKENGPTKKILPKVDLPAAGFYASLDIPVPAPQNEGGVVRCTFDGTEPTSDSEPLTEPLAVEKSMVIRCTEFVADTAAAKSTETYLIGESVSMPVVAVTVPDWYYNEILKAEPCKPDPCKEAKFWLDTAVHAHVEYFAEGSASTAKAFEIDAEASIMGGYSRNQIKKSVSINMKKKIQKGHFRYPLFETRPNQKKFKGFILRNNGNRFVSDYFEDPMATSLLEGTNVDYQRSRQVVVFYNGKYYGIHDMREKLNEHFVETNYGIDAEKVDFVKHTNMTVDASGGTAEDYLDLLNFIFASDLTSENNEAYQVIKNRLSIASFTEYLSAEIYFHNGDWPNNNVRAWRSGTQKWKFVAFDVDHGFDWMWGAEMFKQSTNMFTWIKNGGSGSCYDVVSAACFHNAYLKLIENPDFRRTFINRASIMYSRYLNSEKVTAAVNRIAATIPEAESTRDMKKFPRDYETYWYENSCGKHFSVSGSCMKEWASERDSKVRSEFKKEFDLGDDIAVGFSWAGNGQILLDGLALPDNNYSGTFFGGNLMELTAVGEGKFLGWEDGSTDNPRMVLPASGTIYSATFE